ncbi:MAG: EutN/CcmL family microcompartment protein [Planctomycetia bacterium]|nr:EutN/CcmL family microcompartment protein [Planctomycetia bacterium]
MRIGEVIGTVTLNRAHQSLDAASYRLAIPLTLDDLLGKTKPAGEALVVYDELGAGIGSRIAISEGSEAAQPFHPELKPIDAYNAAILDSIRMEPPHGDRS